MISTCGPTVQLVHSPMFPMFLTQFGTKLLITNATENFQYVQFRVHHTMYKLQVTLMYLYDHV